MGYFSEGRPLMIYFIREDGSDYIKIGSTRMPGDRLKELQISNPRELRIERLIEAFPGAEPILHALFREDRVRGEWFKISKKLEQFMKEDDKKIIETIKFANGLLGKKKPSNHSFSFKAGYGEKIAS